VPGPRDCHSDTMRDYSQTYSNAREMDSNVRRNCANKKLT